MGRLRCRVDDLPLRGDHDRRLLLTRHRLLHGVEQAGLEGGEVRRRHAVAVTVIGAHLVAQAARDTVLDATLDHVEVVLRERVVVAAQLAGLAERVAHGGTDLLLTGAHAVRGGRCSLGSRSALDAVVAWTRWTRRPDRRSGRRARPSRAAGWSRCARRASCGIGVGSEPSATPSGPTGAMTARPPTDTD